MNIEIIISTLTLGDTITEKESQQYKNAVKSALENEYPDSEVNVELIDNVDSGNCFITNVDDDLDVDEIKSNVDLIQSKIWDRNLY